ncbi:MAG: hypothetical protein ACO20H_09100 [Bacteriovoracaceae bacterium]
MKIFNSFLILLFLFIFQSCGSIDARTAYKECIGEVKDIFGIEKLKHMNDCFRDHRY